MNGKKIMKYVENFEEKLDKYAEIIVKVGANIQKNQKVWVNCTTSSLPLVYKIVEKAYKMGASDVNVKLGDDKLTRLHAEYKSEEIYSNIPNWLVEERNYYLDNNVVFIHILGSSPKLLEGIDAKKLGAYAKNVGEAFKYYRSRIMNDINSWTIASYPSKEWAQLVFPNEKDIDKAQGKLLDEILKTVRVDKEDPIKAWDEHYKQLTEKAKYLNEKKYFALHYKSEGTDLIVGLPKGHIWVAAGAKNEKGVKFMPNMPTEEVFTAGDKYRVDGYVSNKKPLSYQGNIIDNFKLYFKDGKVVNFEAEKGYDILKQLLDTDEGAKRIGEVALVPHDSPISNSGLLFCETLFDENASNHLALGAAYPTNVLNGSKMTEEELDKAHVNQSIAHVDFMIGDEKMCIDGIKENGEKEPIFINGNWAF